jgi:hypothetical protein
MSLNAMAEYLTAPPGRRRAIVLEQKRPKAFQVAYYSDAERAITASWSNGLDEGLLTRVVETVRRKPIEGAWDLARQESTIQAIHAFREMVRNGVVPQLQDVRASGRHAEPLLVGGVSVSIRPELLAVSNSAPGGVKFYLSKSAPLTAERGAYAGALLHMYFASTGASAVLVEAQNCFVLDVFARNTYSAPRSFRRRRRDIEAACSEIAGVWDEL